MIEPLTLPEPYVIGGPGPYLVPFPYTTGAVQVQVLAAEGAVDLTADDFTLVPTQADVAGDLFLSGEVLSEWAGQPLLIWRKTVAEQGWMGQSHREKGLEAQLDLLTMRQQEADAELARTLRLARAAIPPITPADQATIIWDDEKRAFVAGPTAAQIAAAQAHAETAQAAAEFAAHITFQDPILFNVVAGQAEYDIGFEPGRDRCQVTIGLSSLIWGIHYEFDEDNPRILRLLQPALYAADAQASIRGTPDRPFAPETVPTFDSLADFRAAEVSPPLNTLIVEGRPLMADAAGPIQAANLRRWVGAGLTLPITLTGTSSELSNDFVGRFEEACEDAATQGWKVVVDPKRDFSPYEYTFIDHLIAGPRLHIEFDGRAIFKPRQNFKHIVPGVSVGPFIFTDETGFSWNPTDWGTLSVGWFKATGQEVSVESSEYTITNSGSHYYITLNAPADDPADILVVAGRKNALGWRGVTNDGKSVISSGHVNIDISRFGYVPSQASGSGLGHINLDNFYHKGLIEVYSGADKGYGAAGPDKRSDSGYTPLNYKNCTIDGTIRVTGASDLAVYASGGGSSDRADDGRGLYIGRLEAFRCATGFKTVRQNQTAVFNSVYLYECKTGTINGETDGIVQGTGHHIGSIIGERMGFRLIDWRDMDEGGSYIGYAGLRDIGFQPDGVTSGAEGSDAPAGLRLSGVKGLTVGCIDFRQRDWAPAASIAVAVNGGDNADIKVLSGHVQGFTTGLNETGATTGDRGCEYRFSIFDVATPIVRQPEAKSFFHIKKFAGDGTVTHLRSATEVVPFTPVLHAGGTPVVVTATDFARGTIVRSDEGWVKVNFDLQIRVTNYTPTGGVLRILGFGIVSSLMDDIVVPTGFGQFTRTPAWLTWPAGASQLVLHVPRGEAYAELLYGGSALASASLTDAAIVTGDPTQRTMRFAGQIIYQTAETLT